MCVCFLCFLQRYMWRVLCHFFYTTNDDWKEGVCNRHRKKVKENANQLQEVWEEECDMETNIHSHQGQKTFQSTFATFPRPTACRAFVIQIHFFLLTPHFSLCFTLCFGNTDKFSIFLWIIKKVEARVLFEPSSLPSLSIHFKQK